MVVAVHQLLPAIHATQHQLWVAQHLDLVASTKYRTFKMNFKKTAIYGLGFFSGIGIALAVSGSASTSVIPYTFADGQIISADTLNDLFTQVNNVVTGYSDSTALVGTWNCKTYDSSGAAHVSANSPSASFSIDAATGMEATAQTWTFTNNGGTLTTSGNVQLGGLQGANITGSCFTANSLSYTTAVIQSTLMATATSACMGGAGYLLPLVKNSPYQFHATLGNTFISCVAANQPPNVPSGLTASVSGGSVNLSWTDNGGSPTGFIVLKKVNGSYTQLDTTAAGVTTYTDTSGTAGAMYRVESSNSNGNSVASAAAKAS